MFSLSAVGTILPKGTEETSGGFCLFEQYRPDCYLLGTSSMVYTKTTTKKMAENLRTEEVYINSKQLKQ